MSAPLVPSPLDYIGRRRFAFYPAIAHSDPNEWLLGTGSRTEVQVINAQTGQEVWISRQYIGAVSETADLFLVVGLKQTLRCRSGSAEPSVKRVIEMPATRSDLPRAPRIERVAPRLSPAPVVGIRLEQRSESALNKALFTTCIGALVVILVAALITAAIEF